MALSSKLLASAAVLYLARAASSPTVPVGGSCLINQECQAGESGQSCLKGENAGKDCFGLVSDTIKSLLADEGSNQPYNSGLCQQALDIVILECAECDNCIVSPSSRLDALPEALRGAAARTPVAAAAAAAAAAASLAAALAGAVVWRGWRAAPASARSALVAEGHEDEDTPMVEGSSAAAPAP
ncbi:unnamed protein product [Prorocentrum cordatum]|uniref:Uncharacterized protein n=1 Tax=Prorocentrum cordatum TaxID=2364126 RepID=A0ABN9RIB5_9DINO|nr:unnamed protein product [Polarella glacialis]